MLRSLLAMSFLLATAAAAQPWTPSPCSREIKKGWPAYERALREAKPGSTLYLPKPFPKTAAEVIGNFEYRERSWKDEPLEAIPARNRPVVGGIRSGSLHYQVDRVEHWTPTRCQSDRPREHYFLLRIREETDGPIVARAAVGQNGL